MNDFYQFLSSNEGLIYLLLTLAAVFVLRWLWRTWRDWRESVFGLEREFAQRRLGQAVVVLLLILSLFVAELILVSFVLPTLPASSILATPTMDLLQSSNSFAAAALVGESNSNATPLVPISASDPSSSIGCAPGTIFLTSPKPGETVRGEITLTGTVDVPSFGFYKYEVSPQSEESWLTISADNKLVPNGNIGIWDTSTLTPGDYVLRLVVTNSEGQTYPACEIPVRVAAP